MSQTGCGNYSSGIEGSTDYGILEDIVQHLCVRSGK
jgi:hypothetical protein